MYFVRYCLWIAPHLLLLLVIAGVLRRRLQKKFPIFLTYLLFEVGQFLLLFAIIKIAPSVTAYRSVLVFGLAFGSLVKVGVLYELGKNLVLRHSALSEVLRPLFRWTTAWLLLLATIASARLFVEGLDRLVTAFETVDFCVSVVQVGLLLTLLMFSRALHVSWRSWAAGIALGFGIAGSIELTTAALRSVSGQAGHIAIDIAQMSAFQVCVGVWLVYLFLPERVPKVIGTGLPQAELELWDHEVHRIVQR